MKKSISEKRPEFKKKVETFKKFVLSPRSKRNIKRFLVVLGVIFMLIISFFVASFMLQLNLMLKGDVLISISPSNNNVLTQSRDSSEVTYRIGFENRVFCTADCRYEFVDLSDYTTVDSGDFTAEGKDNFSLIYNITPPEKGTGQRAYELNVECINRKSYFCKSQGLPRQKSSFFTLSYELSRQERDMVENLSSTLAQDLDNLRRIDIRSKEVSYRNEILEERLHLLEATGMIMLFKENISKAISLSEHLRDLWNEEEYLRLSENLDDLNSSISGLSITLEMIEGHIDNQVMSFQDLENILRNNSMIISAYEELSITNQIIGMVSRDYLGQYTDLVYDFNRNNFSDYEELSDRKQNLYEDLMEDLDGSRDALESINKEGKELLEANNITIAEEIRLIPLNEQICYALAGLENASENENEYLSDHCIDADHTQNLTLDNLTFVSLPEVQDKEFTSEVNVSLKEHVSICCIFDECRECCEGQACIEGDEEYPIVLVHGHAISEESSIENSLLAFQIIKRELVADGFIDGGTIYPNDEINEHEKGVLGKYGKPVLISTTYYVDSVWDVQNYRNASQVSIVDMISKDEDISTYSSRLNDVIEIVKFRTGSPKVNILAHSMGGLVAREYLVEHGESSVNKLIMIGTPNKGVEGRIESFCSVTGNQKECSQLPSTSSFINDLNAPENKPRNTEFYTLYGTGCTLNGKDGDGVVPAENVKLPYALNFEIEGICAQTTLHEDLLNIYKYPKVYELIKNILQN